MLWGAGVFGFAVCVEPANIADSYRTAVLARGVGANLVLRPPCLDVAIQANHIVVANLLESSLTVPAVDVGSAEIFAFGRGAAVYDYLVYFSHSVDY